LFFCIFSNSKYTVSLITVEEKKKERRCVRKTATTSCIPLIAAVEHRKPSQQLPHSLGKSMAKFSFADAGDEDHPPTTAPAAAADAGGGDKRKRDGGPDDGAAGGEPPSKARKLDGVGGGCGREVRRVGGDGDAGVSMRIDPDLLDCSICFEPLCPPLYQVAYFVQNSEFAPSASSWAD
jgi:E3 ubiquitin-protein ligase SIAH1